MIQFSKLASLKCLNWMCVWKNAKKSRLKQPLKL
jgi:hypothetical protein